ncbi:MAG: preprotein translocase subunit SecG [Eubacteriales bacterium]
MLKTILTIIQVFSCLLLIAAVLLQSGKRSGLSGAISGAADTFMSKNKAKTWDARIAKATTWVAISFILLTLMLNIV